MIPNILHPHAVLYSLSVHKQNGVYEPAINKNINIPRIVWYLNSSSYLIYHDEDTKEEEDGDEGEKVGMMWYDVNHDKD